MASAASLASTHTTGGGIEEGAVGVESDLRHEGDEPRGRVGAPGPQTDAHLIGGQQPIQLRCKGHRAALYLLASA